MGMSSMQTTLVQFAVIKVKKYPIYHIWRLFIMFMGDLFTTCCSPKGPYPG